MTLWNSGIIADAFLLKWNDPGNRITLYITYTGVVFLPVSLMFTGLIFGQTKLRFKFRYIAALIPPLVSFLVLVTNDIHYKFYKSFISVASENNVFGSYFNIHSTISYIYVMSGLCMLIFFSIKNSGFFTSQSIMITIGSALPLIVNVLYTFGLHNMTSYATPAAFSFAILCFVFAVLKYNFLNITPIALQKVVDHISDCFLVMN
jgi:hypothetical protein